MPHLFLFIWLGALPLPSPKAPANNLWFDQLTFSGWKFPLILSSDSIERLDGVGPVEGWWKLLFDTRCVLALGLHPSKPIVGVGVHDPLQPLLGNVDGPHRG